MEDSAVPVTAQWALWGRRTLAANNELLASSDGPIRSAELTELIQRYLLPGTIRDLPQLTFAGFSDLDRRTYLAIAIHDRGERDPNGREIVATSCFLVPFDELIPASDQRPNEGFRVSYQALYEAFGAIRLPLPEKSPIQAALATTPPRPPATEFARQPAALLITGRPVCVLGARHLTLSERLRFIDDVASMLPYGIRRQLSAATWADRVFSDPHDLRLVFSDWPEPPDAQVVTWGERPGGPLGNARADAYLAWLSRWGPANALQLARMTEDQAVDSLFSPGGPLSPGSVPTQAVPLPGAQSSPQPGAEAGFSGPLRGAQPGSSDVQPGSADARPGSAGAQPGSAGGQPGSAGAQPGSAGGQPGSVGGLPRPAGGPPRHAGGPPRSAPQPGGPRHAAPVPPSPDSVREVDGPASGAYPILAPAPAQSAPSAPADWSPPPQMAGSAAPPPLATARDWVSEAVQSAVRRGLLLFNPPAEMRQGQAERVEVGIARSVALREALLDGLRGRGEAQFKEIDTAHFMSVELKGDAFAITPYSMTEQIVAETARWEFAVVPTRSGTQTLIVVASVRMAVSRLEKLGGARRSLPVLEWPVRIRVDVPYNTRRFVASNWQWLIATVAGLGGAIAAWITLIH